MGVVTLVDRLVHGGAERLAAEIATRLDPERFESTLCVSRWSDPGHAAAPEVPERLRAAAEAAGVRFLGLSRRGRWDIAAWGPLVRLLRSGHVQVVHGHMFGSNVWAVCSGASPAFRWLSRTSTAGPSPALVRDSSWTST